MWPYSNLKIGIHIWCKVGQMFENVSPMVISFDTKYISEMKQC